jgi:hypothetical protein
VAICISATSIRGVVLRFRFIPASEVAEDDLCSGISVEMHRIIGCARDGVALIASNDAVRSVGFDVRHVCAHPEGLGRFLSTRVWRGRAEAVTTVAAGASGAKTHLDISIDVESIVHEIQRPVYDLAVAKGAVRFSRVRQRRRKAVTTVTAA